MWNGKIYEMYCVCFDSFQNNIVQNIPATALAL